MTDFVEDFHSPKKVHFSPSSTLLMMNASAAWHWYSDKEYEEFRRANAEAVREVQMRLRAQDDKTYGLDGQDVTGIENFLTAESIKRMIDIQKFHRKAILQEQARQRRSGEYDADKLAYISANLSMWSVKRSIEIAEAK